MRKGSLTVILIPCLFLFEVIFNRGSDTVPQPPGAKETTAHRKGAKNDDETRADIDPILPVHSELRLVRDRDTNPNARAIFPPFPHICEAAVARAQTEIRPFLTGGTGNP